MFVTIVRWILVLYWIVLLVRILSSWFPMPMSGPARRGMELVYDVTEPVLRPLRNLIPPVRMGAMAMDFSPILVFIVIGILLRSIG
ncbi:MAG TPA: YggT family protein [Actinomycetota bacterium]